MLDLRSFLRLVYLGAVLSFIIAITSCGGGGDGGDDDDAVTTPAPPISGRFLDSAVEGLAYQSGSNPPRTTDANGTFVYFRGETLTFSIGGIELGTLTDGASVITPFDFGSGAAINIARFLQTLDEDGDSSNGIDLTNAAATLENTVLDSSVFMSDSTTFEADIVPALETALGAGALLIDEVTAITHLVVETASPFEFNELKNHGFVIVFPESNEVGFMNFISSSTVEIMWKSNTIGSGGDGKITINNWSLDVNGTLILDDPIALTTTTIEKVESSTYASSIIMTVETQPVPLIGTILAPVPETVLSLASVSERTYDLVEDSDFNLINTITFYPGGTLSRVESGIQYDDTWEISSTGSLVTILKTDPDIVGMLVMMNGSFTTGGDILYIDATNLSGDPTSLELQLDNMHEGTLAPLIVTNPDGTIPYKFSTGKRFSSGCPANPVDDPGCDIQNALPPGDISVSGTFDYDPSAISDFDSEGETSYRGSITNLTGSVNGLLFSAPVGTTVVNNDGFDYFVSQQVFDADFLLVNWFSNSNVAGEEEEEGLVGFEIAGSKLVGIHMFWTEGRFGATDFLPNNDLPVLLPGFEGGLTLNFKPPGDYGGEGFLLYFFFPELVVSPLTESPTP